MPGTTPPPADQLPIEGLPRRLFVCTPSKVSAYEDCPRRYRFSYVDRPSPPKGPPWAHNSLGASVHTALRGWYMLEPARRTKAAIGTLLRGAWVTDGYRDESQQRSAFRRALDWLDAYLVGIDPADEPVGVERTVAARTPTLALSGRIDRLDRRGDELVVVDYKTGRRPLTDDDARGSRALALYAYATERTMRRRCRRVELHHLPTGTVLSHEHTDSRWSGTCAVPTRPPRTSPPPSGPSPTGPSRTTPFRYARAVGARGATSAAPAPPAPTHP